MRKNDRTEPYATVRSPRTRISIHLNEKATAKLAEIQNELQERLDRKVAAKEIMTGLLLGTLKVD